MFPNVGLVAIIDEILVNSGMALTYHLFKNDYTPVAGSVLADFTESTFGGYAAQTVTEPGSSIVTGPEAESAGNDITFTKTGAPETAQQAFGIYVTFTNSASTVKLLMAWRFSSPTTIAFTGDFVKKKVDWYAKDFAP
jgi:hypothetical protein